MSRWYDESEVRFTVTCSECGAAVVDRADHDEWHDKLEDLILHPIRVIGQ